MDIQTKTYTVGTGAWDSTYVGFVLTLNIIENSVSQADNTSNISYELILSNPNNQYPYEAGSATRYVELVLGPHTLSQDVTGAWVFNSSTTQKVLLSGSVDIAHKADGSFMMGVYAKMPRLRTDGAGPQEMVISDTMALTPIQVAPAACPIVFNGQEVNSVVFNGQLVEHLVFNGTTIF